MILDQSVKDALLGFYDLPVRVQLYYELWILKRQNIFTDIFNFICMFFLYVCFCTTSMQCLQRPEEGLDPTELDLERVISHHVGAEDQTQVLCRNSSCQLEKIPFISLLFHC